MQCFVLSQKALHKLHKKDVVQILCKLLKSARLKIKQVAENQPLVQNMTLDSVGIADEISNIKFIEDFDKIVNFMLSVSHA